MKKEFYIRKEQELVTKLNDLNKHHYLYAWLKLLLFVLLVISFSIGFYDRQIYALLLGLILIVVFMFLLNKQTKIEWQLSLNKATLKTVEEFIKRFDIEIIDFSEDAYLLNEEDNYLGNDLDLVGKKSLFQYLCLAKSKSGQAKLLNSLSSNQPTYKNKQVYELSQDRELHLELSSLISMYDHEKEEFSLNDQQYLSKKRLLFYSLIRIVLPLLFVSTAILYLMDILVLKYLVSSIIINIGFALVNYRFNQQYLSSINVTNNNLEVIVKVLKVFEDAKFKDDNLVKIQEKVLRPYKSSEVFKKMISLKERINSQANLAMYLLAQIILLWDYQNVLTYHKWKKEVGINASEYLEIFYELELLLSLGVIELTKEVTSQVHYLTSKEPIMELENVYHPLLKESKAIKNSFKTKNATIIITGSNMSGKTTFIRTIGINYLLAYAGASVCASKMSISVVKLFTSIRIRDNLDEGISTFYAEIKRVKEMVEYTKTNQPMLCLIDEIFKGTNLNDRIYGAKKVIETLHNNHTISIITTHDPQLCELDQVVNYRFAEHYRADQISFDYLIKEGQAKTSNAKYLLKMAGIIS